MRKDKTEYILDSLTHFQLVYMIFHDYMREVSFLQKDSSSLSLLKITLS
jgi:hypothetical protein